MAKMRTFRLNKLVRDGIVTGHEQEGGSCISRVLKGKELEDALKNKLKEEVDELLALKKRDLGEFGDVLEVLHSLAELDGFSAEDITERALKRSEEIGAFKRGIYVETVTVPETSWLAEYYGSNPQRFPEIDKS
jgi:predicted house-cleaning noncanonical NTP pyrophosphatase (MazG superfamily)